MHKQKAIPKDKCIDSTIALLKEGYHFIPNRMKRYHTDIFETRIMGRKAICISGSSAAKIFYNNELFEKKGALPKRVQKTLFGLNGVQTLDGQKHNHRKQLFMNVLNEEQQIRFINVMSQKWDSALTRWELSNCIVLYDEMKNLICESVCEWANVPLPLSDIESRANDFNAMIFGFGAIGPKYWHGKCARRRTESWIQGIINKTRLGVLTPSPNSALYQVAFFRELDGSLLDSNMAAIELINVLRPIIAISIYVVYTALALYDYKADIGDFLSTNKHSYEMFAQEVRRLYPLTPFLGGIVKKNFLWKKYKFRKGTLVLLDVYGIDHDKRVWNNPYQFDPERFKNNKEHLYDFIPQGGGEASTGHRCPGEGITLELMKLSMNIFRNKINYQVPEQDLTINYKKAPTIPNSGFIMCHIKRKS